MAETGSPANREPALRMLVVIDDTALAKAVDLTLRHAPYARRVVRTLAQAKAAIDAWKPHLLLVDIAIETGAAIDLIDDARQASVAVIALAQRRNLRAQREAFERGADDYIGLPFVPADLLARTRAVVRRRHGSEGQPRPRLRVGDLVFDVIQRKVLAGEQELHLTSREQSLLYFLAANPGTIFTREEILAALWGTEFAGDTRAVDRHIQAIRAKLGDDRHMPRYIETIPGAGYRFVCMSEVSDERHT